MYWKSIAKKRRKKNQDIWSNVNKQINDNKFRLMFCMDCKCFNSLCKFIIHSVAEKQFKSEPYNDAFLKCKDINYDAHALTTGEYVAGEVKVDITLRSLAGGNALDIGVLFDISIVIQTHKLSYG